MGGSSINMAMEASTYWHRHLIRYWGFFSGGTRNVWLGSFVAYTRATTRGHLSLRPQMGPPIAHYQSLSPFKEPKAPPPERSGKSLR